VAKTPQDLSTNSAHDGGRPTQTRIGTRPSQPLIELTLTRVREFLREPEALFWVFLFPILLSCALGLAFRNTGPEKLRVAVESSGDKMIQSKTTAIVTALARSTDIEPVVLTPEEAARGLRSGKFALIVRWRDDRNPSLVRTVGREQAIRMTPRPRIFHLITVMIRLGRKVVWPDSLLTMLCNGHW